MRRINSKLVGDMQIYDMKLSQLQESTLIEGENGILSKKGRGFHFPSGFALKNLPHLIWSDDYLCDTSYEVNRAYVDCFEILNVISGKLELSLDGKEYMVGEDDVVFIDLRDPHHYRAIGNVRVQQYLIDGDPLQAYCQLLSGESGPVYRKDSRISYQLTCLQNETRRQVPNDFSIAYMIIGLVTSLTLSVDGEKTDPIQQARYYIADHFMENISLDDIAKSVSLSKYYFSRQFEKEVGVTPWRFLIETRIRNSMQMLIHTRMTVDEIAVNCGFSDATHFIRTFKKITGDTPGIFRRKNEGSEERRKVYSSLSGQA